MIRAKSKNYKDCAKLDKPVITLKKLTADHQQNVSRWITSPYIIQNSIVVPSRTNINLDITSQIFIKRYIRALIHDPKRLTFAIKLYEEHIGNIGLKDICRKTGVAECFLEIGEKCYRGMGFGQLAMQELLNMAFFSLDLYCVRLDVLEFNHPAIKIYHRLGFIKESESRWHLDEFGQYWRVLRMSITKNDWQPTPVMNLMKEEPIAR